MGLQDEDLSGLTEDERAQLLELEGADDGHGETTGSDGGDAGAAGGDDLNGGADDGADDGADAAGNKDGAGDDGSQGNGQDDASEPNRTEIKPLYQVDADVDALDAKLKQLAQAKRDARRKYEEGELSENEYDAELDRIDTERDQANADRIRAQVAEEMTAQQLKDAYKTTVNDFLKDIKGQGFDYRDTKNAEALKVLDTTIKALAAQPHDQKPEVWRQIFEDAHTVVARRFKIQAEQPKPASDKTRKADPVKDRHPDLSNVPPTIGRGPAAGTTTVEGDEFAHIYNLSGIEAEKAVARLTPEQRARWEAQE